MIIDETVRLLLDSLGRDDEYEFYIKKFKSNVSDCFALICPDSHTLKTQFDVLNINIQFLLKLELMPALLIFSIDVIEIIKILKKNHTHEYFFIQVTITDDLIHEQLKKAKAEKKVPVIWSSELNLQHALIHFTKIISSRLQFVRTSGGMRDSHGNALLYLKDNVEHDLLHENDRSIYFLAKHLLAKNPLNHISISSPYNLLKEIFTIKGAGSIIKKASSIIASKMSQVDQKKLDQLMASSFKKSLPDNFNYSAINIIYYERNYKGAILLEQHDAGMYMSKFAVGSHARGIGIGQELWDKMIEEHKRIFWRSRAGNSINRWYQNKADGFHKLQTDESNSYLVFWRGLQVDHISLVIDYCQKRKDDFI